MRELPSYVAAAIGPTSSDEPILVHAPYDSFINGEEPRIVEIWRVLRAGRWWIAAFAAAVGALTAAYVLTISPSYTAEARILIERRAPQVVDVREILSEGLTGDDANYYRTQQEILQSRVLALDVIRELRLDRDRHLASTASATKPPSPTGYLASAITWLRSLVGALAPERSSAPRTGVRGAERADVDTGVLAGYRASLEIAPINRTRLVDVRFTSFDPVLAARVANAHVKAYVQHGLRIRTRASEDARRFLEEKLLDLRDRLEKSEIALNDYRREKGILSLDEKENIVVDRLSDLNRRLSEAEAERISREAEVKLIQKRDYDSLPGVANNSLIQSLKGQLAEVERQNAEVSAQFKPTYPAVEQLSAQIREMRSRLQREVQKVVASIESAFLAAADRESELRRMMEQQKAETLNLKDAAVQYAILKRETDANRELYDSILQRMKEIGVASAVQASNVSLIDEATPPRTPSFPKRFRALLTALLAGAGLGVGFVFGRHYLDSSVKGPEDVERQLRLPNLGVVPDFDRLDLSAVSKGALESSRIKLAAPVVQRREKDIVLASDSFSVVTESYRTLRTAILFSRPESTPHTLLFTSAMDSEGKTTSSINAAIVFAKLGATVLVIDADLRRATCHRKLGVTNLSGLTELMTGLRTFDESVRNTPFAGVSLIPAGSAPPNPTELLGSRAMANVLACAVERFDYVIIDSPPVMPVNDAVVLSPLVDGVVMVVKARHTPRRVLLHAQSRLRQARARILGVLLNQLDTRSDHYSTYYGGSYYSAYYGESAGDAAPVA